MTVTVRPARSGDGAGISREWLSTAGYDPDLDPGHFRVPDGEDQAEGRIQNARGGHRAGRP
jgi:hypothetical protein